jgi:hypothetical protein
VTSMSAVLPGRALVGIAICSGLLVWAPRAAECQLHLGWADEFAVATVVCGGVTEDSCIVNHAWSGGPDDNPRWEYVGAQNYTTAGRANAVERVQLSYRDSGPTVPFITLSLVRHCQDGNIPNIQNGCTTSLLTLVASAQYTVSSSQFGAAAHYHNHRLLPSLDFSQGTPGGPGQTKGYRSRVHGSIQAGDNYLDGCYKIYWYP